MDWIGLGTEQMDPCPTLGQYCDTWTLTLVNQSINQSINHNFK